MRFKPHIVFIYLTTILVFVGCSCIMGSYPRTKIKHSKYYKNNGNIETSILKNNQVYGSIKVLSVEKNEYQFTYFKFFKEGMVLRKSFLTNSIEGLDSATIFKNWDTYKNLKNRCSGREIGTYNISGSSIKFTTKVGDDKYWSEFQGKINQDSLIITHLHKKIDLVGGKFHDITSL